MSEEFSKLMQEGFSGLVDLLGNKRKAKDYTRSLTVSDANLFIDFIEQNEVGERISVDDSKAQDINSPILARDDSGNIRLQTYLSVLTNTQASQKILDKIEVKYPGFTFIKPQIQRQMLDKLLDKYEVTLTPSVQRKVGGTATSNVELKRKLNRSLAIFSDRATGRELNYGMLDRVRPEKLTIDSDASLTEKRTALEVFNQQPEDIKPKLEPFIELLEKILRMDGDKERLNQPSDVLQDLIGQGDLRLTKNREKIYDYWKGINDEFEELEDAHNTMKEVFEKAYPKTEDMQDKELAGYIAEFKKYEARDLKYVYQYDGVGLTTLDAKSKTLEVLDSFLAKIQEKPEAVYGVQDKEDSPTGYRISEGGQVGEISDGRDIGQKRRLIQDFAELIRGEVIGVDVDPLYAFSWKRGMAGFRVSPTMANEMKKLENRLKRTAIRLDLDNRDIREMKQYIKDIDMKSVIGEGDFFLPYQEDVIETIYDSEQLEEKKADNRKIETYLKNLSQFISAGSEAEQPTGAGESEGQRIPADPKTGRKFETVQEGRGMALPSKGAFRSKLPALGKVSIDIEREKKDAEGETVTDDSGNPQIETITVNLEKALDRLLKAVEAYYIEPATSDSKPKATRFEWQNTQVLSVLGRKRMNKNAFITMMSLERGNVSGLLLDEVDLRLIVNLLKRLSRTVSKQTVQRFMDTTEDAARAVDDAFEGNDANAVSIEFGNMAYNILTRNGIDTKDIEFGIGSKKKLKEWSDMYDTNKVYPFQALYYHVTGRQEKYTKLGGNFIGIINDIKRLEDKLDVIRKTELERNFLNAHDSIRKMMRKPVYYAISSVDDYEDMEHTLKSMKSKFNIDLTAMEVEGIVKELDSMENLSRKYGISTEGVYYLKATHR